MRLDLSDGFLFRPTSKKGGVVNAPPPPPTSPLPFKPDLPRTFHLSASMTVKLCTVLDPEPPSFLYFSECLERLLPSTLAESLRRWLTTILKWTRLCLPIPLPIPWLIVEGDRGAGGIRETGEERAGGEISTMAGSEREIKKDKLLLFVAAYFQSKKRTQERFLTSI